MGYAKSDVVTITLCEEKYQVVVNRKLSVENAKRYRALRAEIPEDAKDKDLLDGQCLMAVTVMSWNLDDDDGNIWPLDAEHFDMLDVEDAKMILEPVRGSRKPKTPQEEASFLLPPTPGSEGSEPQLPPDTMTSSPENSSGNILEFPTTEETAMTGTPIISEN